MNRMHHRILATIGAAGLAATTLAVAGTAQAATPPNPYVNYANGHTSTYTVVRDEVTWEDANALAEATAAPAGCDNHLAVITSQSEQDYLFAAFGYVNDLSIGLKRTAPHADTFEWVTGETFDYTNWNGGEPNDFITDRDDPADPGEPFGQFSIDNKWNDISPTNTGVYLVETECTPTGLQVTDVDPNSGSAGGGNDVTIYGSGFTAGASVLFASKKATNVTVVNDFTITATVPSVGKTLKKPKTVDVQVRIKNKKSAKTSADKYTYNPESNNT